MNVNVVLGSRNQHKKKIVQVKVNLRPNVRDPMQSFVLFLRHIFSITNSTPTSKM